MGVKEMKIFIVIFLALVLCVNHSVAAQKLNIISVKQHTNSLEIEFVLGVTDNKDIFIVTPNPKNKLTTSYYLTFDEKNSLLEIRRNFYEYPLYITDTETQCFTLSPVKSKGIYKETIFVNYPVSLSYLSIENKIDISKVKSIRLQLGVLPFDDTLSELQNRKPFGRCVDGQEKISEGHYKGRALIEVQNILKSNIIKIN
jgi:hypothetical protein